MKNSKDLEIHWINYDFTDQKPDIYIKNAGMMVIYRTTVAKNIPTQLKSINDSTADSILCRDSNSYTDLINIISEMVYESLSYKKFQLVVASYAVEKVRGERFRILQSL
jgi:hypothetical protein